MKDNYTLTGRLRFQLFNSDGIIVEDKEGPNLIVNAGKAQVAALLAGTSTSYPVAMAVGTDSTAPSLTNTALGAEIPGGRVAMSSSTQVGAQTIYVANFPAGVATGTIAEAGLFSNTVSGGTMTSRSTSLTVVKGASDSLQITWTLTIT